MNGDYDFHKPIPSGGSDISDRLEQLRGMYDCVLLSYDSRDGYWEVECYDYSDYDTGLRDDGSKPRRSAIICYGETPGKAIDSALRSQLAAAEQKIKEQDERGWELDSALRAAESRLHAAERRSEELEKELKQQREINHMYLMEGKGRGR